MNHTARRVSALVCCLPLLSVRPGFRAAADSVSGVSYLDSPALTAAVNDITQNGCPLFTDKEMTPVQTPLTLNSAMDTQQNYYIFADDGAMTFGKQCYIYAQGAYAALFGELAGHGESEMNYDHSEEILSAEEEICASLLSSAGVMPGAYLRTTANPDGSYNGYNGHSLLILGYTSTDITILEGNADGWGLIRSLSMSYDAFNRSYLGGKGRMLSHIVQPTAEYYEQRYGLSYAPGDFPRDLWQTPRVELHRKGVPYQLNAPEYDLVTWESQNPEIAQVSDSGAVTAVSDGTAVITANGLFDTYDYEICVRAADWGTLGDIDRNGVVEITDAQLVLAKYTESAVTGSLGAALPEDLLSMDIDDDGSITITDAQLVCGFYTASKVCGTDFDPAALWEEIFSVNV